MVENWSVQRVIDTLLWCEDIAETHINEQTKTAQIKSEMGSLYDLKICDSSIVPNSLLARCVVNNEKVLYDLFVTNENHETFFVQTGFFPAGNNIHSIFNKCTVEGFRPLFQEEYVRQREMLQSFTKKIMNEFLIHDHKTRLHIATNEIVVSSQWEEDAICSFY